MNLTMLGPLSVKALREAVNHRRETGYGPHEIVLTAEQHDNLRDQLQPMASFSTVFPHGPPAFLSEFEGVPVEIA